MAAARRKQSFFVVTAEDGVQEFETRKPALDTVEALIDSNGADPDDIQVIRGTRLSVAVQSKINFS